MKVRHKIELVVALALGIVLTGTTAWAQVSGELVDPSVMLLIDSSGSMDWTDNTPAGVDPWEHARTECEKSNSEDLNDIPMPYEPTSWQKMLDAFLGGIEAKNRRCAVEPRAVRPSLKGLDPTTISDFVGDSDGDGTPDNISEFRKVYWPHYRAVSCPPDPADATEEMWHSNDLGFYQCFNADDGTSYTKMDGFVCHNVDNVTTPENENHVVDVDGQQYCMDLHYMANERQSNGILDRYENMVRFGIMTYDNVPSCLGASCDDHDKLWNFGADRDWTCQGTGETYTHACEDWNAGARADMTGAIGGMVEISSNIQGGNSAVRTVLNTMEPLYCSPLGALVDDVGSYFGTDTNMLPRGGTGVYTGNDPYYRCRPKVAVLISDGQPTAAFEFPAGGCRDLTEDWEPTADPTGKVFACPWRSSAVEAAELYDVSIDALNSMTPPRQNEDCPVYLVAVGFNVPEVDCEVNPEDCYPYTSKYYEYRHCYENLPPCLSAPVSGSCTTPVPVGFECAGGWGTYGWSRSNWEISPTYSHEGSFSAMTSAIPDSTTATLEVKKNVESGNACFWLSGESHAADRFRFLIDDVVQSEWSGDNQTWTQACYAVTAGTHTFRWEYVKDNVLSQGWDAWYLDDVRFPGICQDECSGLIGDAGVGDWDAGVEETCLMTPRDLMNEMACQGWPWQPERAFEGHVETRMPPWLDPALGVCAPSGYTGDPKAYPCLDGERALFVHNPNMLSKALDLVIGGLTSTVGTRTDVVHWNATARDFNVITDYSGGAAYQYEFRTGYVARHGEPWQGVLTRKDWNCVNGSTDVDADLMNVAEKLETQATPRKIYSILEPDNGGLQDEDYPAFTPNNLTNWVQLPDSDLVLTELTASHATYNDCDFGVGSEPGIGSECANHIDVAEEVVDYMQNRGLGDIYNSTPAVLGPVLKFMPIPSYLNYRLDNSASTRPPFLFVGTNDGVLHAFNIDQMPKEKTEVLEQWSYVPRSVIGLLREQFPIPEIIKEYSATGALEGYGLSTERDGGIHQHLFLFDGSIVARDVLLARNAELVGGSTKDHWRAIVFGGLGKGARGYYALDVTESIKAVNVAPKLRWEISPNAGLWGNNEIVVAPAESEAYAAFNDMGFPVSKPALAYVGQRQSNTNVIVAAAILPGGWKSDSGNTGVSIVRLGDGQLIRHFDPGVLADLCDTNGTPMGNLQTDESAQLIGEPTVIHGTMNLRQAREVLIGDDRGRIWMIDMDPEDGPLDDFDPDKWCLRMYFDTMIAWHYPYEDCVPRIGPNPPVSTCTEDPTCFQEDCCNGEASVDKCGTSTTAPRNMNGPRVMILGAPTVAMDDQNKPVIVFGSGQYDRLSSWNRNRIFSLTDVREVVGGKNTHTPKINWWIGDARVTGWEGEAPVDALYNPWLIGIHDEMENTHVDWDGIIEGAPFPQYFWNVGEKLVGRPAIFDGIAYFTTYVPIENAATVTNACDAGSSRVWGVHFNYNMITDAWIDFSDVHDTQFGAFEVSGERRMYHDYPGELLSGVQVVARPQCDNFAQPPFSLVVQSANQDASFPRGAPVPVDAVQSKEIQISKGLGSAKISQARFDSWSIVFE
ncbi:MAG: hypothetical protein GY854_14000 [Deltaproteobacteria bacterium]|nr:hypothetical protein [Deltaproteobacteria bacterium]